jgi:hypothetical protein
MNKSLTTKVIIEFKYNPDSTMQIKINCNDKIIYEENTTTQDYFKNSSIIRAFELWLIEQKEIREKSGII